MSLLLRSLKVLVAAFFRSRLAPLDESAVTFRVWPNDLDVNLHMNNGRYLTLMDLGRLDLIVRLGVLGALRRRKWGPVVGSLKIRYRRSLLPFQTYEIRTRLLCWDHRWFFVEQRFERRGELIAIALVKGLFLGPEGRVPTQAVVDASGFRVQSPPAPDAVLAWQDAERVLREHEALPVEVEVAG
ncbi:MAG TPA: thioesterase family protein [Longimicrobiaceae bacterium]|nr:thioesterase family protein [Longimicrobiaceae bacterium]